MSSPLYQICKRGDEKTLSVMMLSSATIDINHGRSIDGATPLFIAAGMGHTNIVKILLSHTNIDVNKTRSSDQASPLFMSCSQGHEKIVENLLKHSGCRGVNDVRVSDGASPLWVAAYKGHAGIVKLLLARDDVDVNLQRADGTTALFMACCVKGDDDSDTISMLLEHPSIDVNIADSHNATPLWVACQKGNVVAVDLLLKNNALEINKAKRDVKVKQKKITRNKVMTKSFRVLDVTLPKRRSFFTTSDISNLGMEVTEVEESEEVNSEESSEESSEENNEENVLGEQEQQHEASTPLWIAVQNKHTEIVKLLVEGNWARYVDVHAEYQGWSPVGIAHQSRDKEIIALLANAGALESAPSSQSKCMLM